MNKNMMKKVLERLKKERLGGHKARTKGHLNAYAKALLSKKKLPKSEKPKEYKPISQRAKAYQSLKTPEEYEKFLKNEEEDEGRQNFIKNI